MELKKGNALKHSLYPEFAIANIDDGIKVFAAATDGPIQLGLAQIERATEMGQAECRGLKRNNPLDVEGATRDIVVGMARSILAGTFAALDGHGSSLQVDGRTCRAAGVTPGRAIAMFGQNDFLRSRYRSTGHAASLVPAKASLA